MKYMRQCVLRSGNSHTTAWIDESGAKRGKSITLTDSDSPKKIWVVEQVYARRITATEAKEQARASVKFANAGSLAKDK